jgi:hypothetical protein
LSSDYSVSLGLTGQRNHPDVVKAERRTIETALKMGLHPRVELADIKQAAPYLEMGVKHFCIGWDVRTAQGTDASGMFYSSPSAASVTRLGSLAIGILSMGTRSSRRNPPFHHRFMDERGEAMWWRIMGLLSDQRRLAA